MKRLIVLLGVAGVSLSAVFVRWSTAPSLILALYRMAFFGGADGGPGTGGTKAGAEIPDPAGRAAVPCQRLVWASTSRRILGPCGPPSIASAVVLVDTEVFFVAAASALFLGQRLPRRTWPAVLLAFCRQRGGGAGRQRRRDECAAGRFDCPGFGAAAMAVYTMIGTVCRQRFHISVHLSGVYVRRGHAAGCGPAERNAAGRLRSGERADGPGHGGMLHPAGHNVFSWGLKYLPPAFIATVKQ